jgi:hypothetical protein
VNGWVTDCAQPAIAIDGSGTVGILFVGGASSSTPRLWYTYRTGTTWSTPMDIVGGRSPTMVGYGSSMHLAFLPMGSGTGVCYWTYPSNAPIVWSSSFANQVDDVILCGETQNWFHPSIAVSGPTSNPIVQVAFFKRIDARTSICFPQSLVFLETHVRRRDTSTSTWPDQFVDARVQNPCSLLDGGVGISLSLASDASGQYFLGWSDVCADTACPSVAAPRTAIARMDASDVWTPTHVVATTGAAAATRLARTVPFPARRSARATRASMVMA